MKTKSSVAVGEKGRAFIGQAVKGIDSKARTIRAYASTNAWDRYGERFAPGAFKEGLANYKANPVVLFAHDYSKAPIAKTVGYEFDAKGLILTMKFADTAEANEVFALYEGGYMSAFSVGFQPREIAFEERVKGSGDMGAVFVKAELLENSAVPVPANPEAVVIKGLGGISRSLSGDLLRSMLEAPYHSRSVKAEEEPASAPQSAPEAQEPPAAAPAAPTSSTEAPQASQEPAAEPEKGFAEALTALIDMAKAARGKKVENEAVRSLLLQTANLCREMLFGKAAESLEGSKSDLTEAEAISIAKELELLAPAVMARGSKEEQAAVEKLMKQVAKALGPISGE